MLHRDCRTHARASFGFMLAFATVTLATHFTSLTLGRALAGTNPALAAQLGFGWPSLSLALDLLVREKGYRRGAFNPFLIGY